MRSLALVLAAAVVVTPVASTDITFQSVGSIPIQADSVELRNGLAYLAAGRTLSIFDVKDPASPKALGSYTFPEEIWAFRLQDQTAYVGVNFFGLGILDVSNPSSPSLRGSFKTPGQAKVGAVVGNRALVIDHMEGVVEVNIAKPEMPSSPGSFFVEGYARDVVAHRSFAYAVDSPTGLYVFDLSRPGPLEPVASLQNGTALRTVDVFADDGPPMVVAVGGGVLQLYDVSTPAAPRRLPAYRTPGGAQRVALKGRLAYVADGTAGLTVVDLTNPAAPAIVGSYKTPTAARDAAAADSLALVAVANGNVVILRETMTP
jgi:hypothetical protein